MKKCSEFSSLLEIFFTERLIRQRQVSPHTLASYRDTFCLLLRFAQEYLKKTPSQLTLDDLNAVLIGDFLNYLEDKRGNTARTRNTRLAAIHSFFKFLALRQPDNSNLITRVLAIPSKRFDRKAVQFLTQTEIDELLTMPNESTWTGRRDRTLLLLAIQTGLRVSELITLKCQDIVFGPGAHVRCFGKGRKERCTPLSKEAIPVLRSWLQERHGKPTEPIFPNARGGQLSRDGVEYLLKKYVAMASQNCQSFKRKRVSPHTLRHTAAMNLLQHGIDRFVIALWLGHESIQTTQMYIHADMKMKEQALAKTQPLNVKPGRYRPNDTLMTFLSSL
jgi:site-specific recombinase XerD